MYMTPYDDPGQRDLNKSDKTGLFIVKNHEMWCSLLINVIRATKVIVTLWTKKIFETKY
jgi:hypothetical protein